MIIRLGKKAIKICLWAVAVVVILLASFIGRLAVGPIPIAWAVPWIEQAMMNEGGFPAALAVNDMSLAWNPDTNRIEFTAHHVNVIQQNASLTGVDQLGLTFSTLALLIGKVHLKDITLISPHFQFALGTAADAPKTDTSSSTLSDNKEFLKNLHSVTLHGGVIDITHTGSTTHDVIDHVELKWKRGLLGSAGTLGANLQMADTAAPSPLAVTLTEDRHNIQITAGLQNILPANIQFILDHTLPGVLPTSLSLDRLQMSTSANAQITLNPQGALQTATGTITAGSGKIILPEYYQAALQVDGVEVKGSYDAHAGNWQIDRLATTISDNDGAIPIVVTVDGNTSLHTIHVDAALHDMTVAQMKRWWPNGVAPGAIEWLGKNLKEGKIPRMAAAVDLHAADGQTYNVTRVQGGFDLQNISTTFLPTLPAVSGINAKVTMDADSMHFDVQSGHLGDIVLQPGMMDITGLSGDIQTLKIDLPQTAQLPSVLRLLDSPPYEYIKKMGVNAATANGGVGLDVKMEFPLLAALKVSDIKYRAVANLSQVSLPNALMGKDVSRGQGVLEMDPEHLKISGQADLTGVPIEFTWQDFMMPKDNLQRQIKFTSELMDEDHARLGLPTAGRVNGSTKLTGTYETRSTKSGAQSILHAEMNFQDAAVHIDELSYTKPAGAILNLTTDMTLGNTTAFKLNASGKDLLMNGGGTLDSNMNPLRLDFPTMKLGSKTDVQLAFEQLPNQQRWMLSGNALDISQFITSQSNTPKSPTTTPPRAIQIKLGTLYLANQASMKNVQADLNHNGRIWDKIIFHGNLNPNIPLDINWDLTAPLHKLTARTQDLGATLAAFGVTDAMIGGELVVDGASDKPAPNTDWLAHGNIMIKNFRTREVPLLGRLIAAVSPGEMLDKLRGKDGVGFDKFETQYEYSDSLLRLREGKMHGQSLGLSFEGDIHHAVEPKTLMINGTIVPLYMVNNALSGIPLIGDIISGKNGAGLLGFNFTASGPSDNPNVSVNALSGFAPGFLRDLFFDNSTLPKKDSK